jgi:hypothetical protein
MRFRRHLLCLGLLVPLVLTTTAEADIAPIARPSASATTVAPASAPQPVQQPVQQTPVQTPIQQAPVQQTPVQQAPVQQVTPPAATIASAPTTPAKPRTPVLSRGGRTQVQISLAASAGGRLQAVSVVQLQPAAATLYPTKLAVVGDEALPYRDTWPSWVLAAITLLVSAEAFLLVRLARARSFHQQRFAS